MTIEKTQPSHDQVIAATRLWLQRAVIGLNLCPFAKGVHGKGLVRYVVSDAQDEEELLGDLERELQVLLAAPPEEVDTTLLIHPLVLNAFADFVRFLDLVEVVLRTQRLQGVLQVASFHPDYVFADSEADDITNLYQPLAFPDPAPAARGQPRPRGGRLSRCRSDLRAQHADPQGTGPRRLAGAGRRRAAGRQGIGRRCPCFRQESSCVRTRSS
jgi:hypothetical protein